MSYITLQPAYGRDYKSAKEVKAAWEAGKDFMVASMFGGGGSYVNKEDAPPKTTFNIRYKRNTQICVIRS